MKRQLIGAGKVGALLGATVAAGYAVVGCFNFLEPKPKHPSERNYDEIAVRSGYFHPKGSMDADSYIWDRNEDGIADAIGIMGYARWYSDDWDGPKEHDARKMTPDMIDKATEAMNVTRGLGKLLTEDAFEEFEEEQARKNKSKD